MGGRGEGHDRGARRDILAPSMPNLKLIGARDATGTLREAYEHLTRRDMPAVYRPVHDDAPGIIRTHSLDPELMKRAFRVSGEINGKGPLTWSQRELVNAVTSRLNQCFY